MMREAEKRRGTAWNLGSLQLLPDRGVGDGGRDTKPLGL